MPKLFGVDGGEGDFFQKAWETFGNLGETSGITILVGGLSLVLVLALKRINPAIPASLLAVAAGEDVRAIVLDLESVPSLDVSAARMLAAIAADLHRDGIELRLARVVGQVHDVLDRSVPSTPAIYPTIAAAVAGGASSRSPR